jgi:NADPH:quinone reductase-like Zn-dependent oxidoreductase
MPPSAATFAISTRANDSVIDATFPLAEEAKAHAKMESSDHVGKIVLTVG